MEQSLADLELAVGDKGRGAGLWDGMQAVFGPIGDDGYPKPIWDKRTGAIDPESSPANSATRRVSVANSICFRNAISCVCSGSCTARSASGTSSFTC